MHELLHIGWGLDDTDIMTKLGIPAAAQKLGSFLITNWMRDNCVKGQGNE